MKALFTDEALIKMGKQQKAGKDFEYKNMDKFKEKFIKNFIAGKNEDIYVTLSNSSKPMVLDIMELNPFGATPQWSWEEVQGMINGDKKVLNTVEAYLNDEALVHTFKPDSMSSITNTITDKVDMQLFKDGLHDEVVIVDISYGNLVLYSNNAISGN